MPSRRAKESDASSLDSLLSWAGDSERQRIEQLLRELEQETRSPPPPNGSQPAAAEVVAKTRAEAAKLLGVDERTISKWASDPTFPGKSGDAGARNGHFPIEAIKRWRGIGSTGSSSSEDDSPAARLRMRKLAAETLKKEIQNERELGRLIDREDQISTVTAAVSSMRSILEELPEWLAMEYPADKPRSRKRARRVARRVVARALQALADAVRGDLDDDSDSAEPATQHDAAVPGADDRQSAPSTQPPGDRRTARGNSGRTRRGKAAKS